MKNYTYQNNLIAKKQLRQLLAWSFTNYDSMQACFLADELKYLGFKYATQAGISISIEDLKIPFVKNLMIEKANQEIINAEKIYQKGKITDVALDAVIETLKATIPGDALKSYMPSSGSPNDVTVNKCYQKAALTNHPDKIADPKLKAMAEEKMKILNRAKDYVTEDDPHHYSFNVLCQGQGTMTWFKRPDEGSKMFRHPNDPTRIIYETYEGLTLEPMDHWTDGKVALVRTGLPHGVKNEDNEDRDC
jgi:hypothetical protein